MLEDLFSKLNFGETTIDQFSKISHLARSEQVTLIYLPNFILLEILEFLTNSELLKLATINRTWYQLTMSKIWACFSNIAKDESELQQNMEALKKFGTKVKWLNVFNKIQFYTNAPRLVQVFNLCSNVVHLGIRLDNRVDFDDLVKVMHHFGNRLLSLDLCFIFYTSTLFKHTILNLPKLQRLCFNDSALMPLEPLQSLSFLHTPNIIEFKLISNRISYKLFIEIQENYSKLEELDLSGSLEDVPQIPRIGKGFSKLKRVQFSLKNINRIKVLELVGKDANISKLSYIGFDLYEDDIEFVKELISLNLYKSKLHLNLKQANITTLYSFENTTSLIIANKELVLPSLEPLFNNLVNLTKIQIDSALSEVEFDFIPRPNTKLIQIQLTQLINFSTNFKRWLITHPLLQELKMIVEQRFDPLNSMVELPLDFQFQYLMRFNYFNVGSGLINWLKLVAPDLNQIEQVFVNFN